MVALAVELVELAVELVLGVVLDVVGAAVDPPFEPLAVLDNSGFLLSPGLEELYKSAYQPPPLRMNPAPPET